MSAQDHSASREGITLILLNVYSSLMLKTSRAMVVFDPVRLNLDNPVFDTRSLDAIVVTHELADHFDEKLVLEMQKRSGAPIITTPFLAQRLGRVGGEARGLKVGDSVKVKDVTLYAEHCTHPANEPLSFVIKTTAVTIYHPVDSEPFPGMREIGSKYEPGIVLYLRMSKERLIRLAEMVRPRIIVSYFVPKFADLKIPGVELKMVKQLEAFSYPSPE